MNGTVRHGAILGIVGIACAAAACVPIPDAPRVTGPEPPGTLEVTLTPETLTVFEGESVTLSAEATGGTAPYRYRWDRNGGPADVLLTEVAAATITTPALTTTGRYTFRVVASDSADQHTQAFVVVEVRPAVTADVPAIAVIGEPVELSASIAAEAGDVEWEWAVTGGSASIEDPTSPTATLTTTAAETVDVVLTVTLASSGDAPVTTTQSFEVVSIPDLAPRVVIETDAGDITLELDGVRAPRHTANFLLYVDDGFYDGLIFHRNACTPNVVTGTCDPFVLQGGGYLLVDGQPEKVEPTRDAEKSEAPNGLSNSEVYSVALALSFGNRDSGQTEFFINLAENGFLDAQGFTVFAHVIDGTDVVDAIIAGERTDSAIVPGEVSFPVEPVIMHRVRRE